MSDKSDLDYIAETINGDHNLWFADIIRRAIELRKQDLAKAQASTLDYKLPPMTQYSATELRHIDAFSDRRALLAHVDALEARVARLQRALTELERPSVLRAAIRAAGDPDMEWWHKGWTAAVRRMRAALAEVKP